MVSRKGFLIMRSFMRSFALMIFTLALIISSLFSLNVSAQESNLNDVYSLELETDITVPVKFVRESSSASLDYLTINYSWIPENDYRQELKSYRSVPSGGLDDDNLIINVEQPIDFQLAVEFTTYTTAAPIEVTQKTEFPIKKLDPRLVKYTLPADKVDINEDIRKKATELAGDEDDLYAVVFSLADWVNSNIEYNLSTTTIDASLPSSWVYENRYGVCDELSNLFISMCRSLGIPARFVSGIAYTDDERFVNSWGAHGWAEVYFPEYGWIPFDPTYNQLGYVDATHIKFEDKIEAGKNALEYTWLGRDIEVTSGQISINGAAVREGPVVPDDFSIDVGFMSDDVSIDSYNVVKATVRNYRNYYVAAELLMSRTQGLQTISEESQDILLKPHETKIVYWIVKTDALDDNYIYTFPITVYSSKEETTARFTAEGKADRFNLQTAENYVAQHESQTTGPGLQCTTSEKSVYVGEPVIINCISNSTKRINFCIEEECSLESSPIISKTVNFTEPGFSTMKLSASSDGRISHSFVSLNVLDKAEVSMNLSGPEKIRFDEKGTIRVSLSRESSNIPQNAVLNISTELMHQSWNISSIDDKKEFILDFFGQDFQNGVNEITVELEFSDELGRKYSESEKIEVELYDLTFFQKIYVWINSAVAGVLV